MNIVRHDLRENRRTFLIWTISLTALSVWLISMYTSVAGPGTEIQKYAEVFPEAFKKAFGMDRLSLGNVMGYFGIEVHFMIILFGSMFAVILSSSLLSREENERTVEFLLTRPVTRQQVLTAKLGVYVVYVLLFSAIVWSASYFTMVFLRPADLDSMAFWRLAVMTTLVLLTFSDLGFLASVFISRSRTALSAGLGLVLGAYALQVASDLSENLSALRFITPMKWASASRVLTAGVDRTYVGIMLVVNAAALLLTYRFYGKKDILV